MRELVASGREHLLEIWAEQGYELVAAGDGWLNFVVGGQLVSRHRLDPNLEDLAKQN